jgi:hypothetical protein
MAETYIVENVEALWPKIDKTYAFDQSVKRSVPCSPRDQNAEFSIAFRMSSATAKALFMQMKGAYDANKEPKWADKLVNPFVKDDNGTYTHKANLKGAYKGEVTNKPLQVDSQGTPLPEDFQLTTGSTVSVAVQLIPYDFGGKQSVSLRLKAVQVIKYAPMEVRNPFASTPKAVKSNNVLDEAPTIALDYVGGGFEEEPVKRTAKKAATVPPSDDGDLGSIIDNWDD